ncbi:Hypothetical predicted protein, partial [Paramuricea clavata]
MIVVLSGSTARLKWSFRGKLSQTTLLWHFTRRGSSNEDVLIAGKFGTRVNAQVFASSSPGVAIETPATLVLNNVDECYNGKYRFTVQVYGGIAQYAVVEVFIL